MRAGSFAVAACTLLAALVKTPPHTWLSRGAAQHPRRIHDGGAAQASGSGTADFAIVQSGGSRCSPELVSRCGSAIYESRDKALGLPFTTERTGCPDAPTVEASPLVNATVRRGELVREVRSLGSLVPE
jgi:hypothetical protein